MRSNIRLIGFTGLIFIFCALLPYSSGSPGGKTGSITDVSNCTQCHSGTATKITEWITTNIPETGYIPGETYNITATGTHDGVVKFGFEITAEDNSGVKKGLFIITNSTQTKLINSNKAVTHKSGGNTPDNNSKSWNMDWQAPDPESGDITFYAAFNAANGNGTTSGDVIYKTSLAVIENTSSGIDANKPDSKELTVYQSSDLNTLILKYSDKSLPTLNIRIIDLNGKLLISKSKTKSANDDIYLNINELKTDIYIIQLETKEDFVSKKVFISK